MHPETRKEIGFLLTMLGEKGEKETANISEIYISRAEVFLRITGNMKARRDRRSNGSRIMSFTHLHVHTEYSLLDGSNKIKEVCGAGQRAWNEQRGNY